MPLIVSITSLKGGVGKTSMTLALASAALAARMRVLVIDMDPHGDSSTGLDIPASGTDIGTMLASPGNYQFLNEIVPSGWNELAEHHSEEEGQDSEQDAETSAAGTVYVARGSAASTALENLTTERALPRLKRLLQDQVEGFDLVLIDCPPTLGRLTSMAWAVSDRVISVAEPSLFSVAGTERTLRAIARFAENTEYSVQAASVVINKTRENDPEHDYRIAEMKTLFADLVAEPALPEFPEIQRIQGSAYPLHYWPTPHAAEFSERVSTLLQGLLEG